MRGKSKRRKWSAAEKLRIVLAGLDGTIEISELCRREEIFDSLFTEFEDALIS